MKERAIITVKVPNLEFGKDEQFLMIDVARSVPTVVRRGNLLNLLGRMPLVLAVRTDSGMGES